MADTGLTWGRANRRVAFTNCCLFPTLIYIDGIGNICRLAVSLPRGKLFIIWT